MTRRVLITGATGYIGGHLARKMVAEGWTVHALVREDSDTSGLPTPIVLHRLDGSITCLRAAVMNARPDIVYHLASLYLSEHRPDQVQALIESNVLFPTLLAQAMVDVGVLRLVNTGTASQYSGETDYCPASLYAATKQAYADLLHYFHRAQKLSVATLGIFDTYGDGDPRRKIVKLLLEATISGRQLHLSPGEQLLDLTHVEDVVDAFLLAGDLLVKSDQPVCANYLLSGERLTLLSLGTLISAVTGLPLNANFGALPYRKREVMVPTLPTSQQILPGWRPRYTLRDGLAKLVANRARSVRDVQGE